MGIKLVFECDHSFITSLLINLIYFRTQTKYQMAKRTTTSQTRTQNYNTGYYHAYRWESEAASTCVTPTKFENSALFLRLGLPSTQNKSITKTELFRKLYSNLRNLKTPTFRFRVDGKHFENEAFWKRWRHNNHVISLTKFSSTTNPKWPLTVFEFLRPGVDGKHIWYVLRVKT